MKLTPGRCVRKINSQAWSRYSIKKPKKNYIKARPRTSLTVFNMGVDSSDFDIVLTLNAKEDVQLRSNSLEAARQSANKYLGKEIPGNYYMRVVPFPHNVIREKKFATGAGADRISQGMILSFGRPTAVAARVRTGQSILELKTVSENKEIAREALRRASSKLSGTYSIFVRMSSKNEAVVKTKSEVVVKN